MTTEEMKAKYGDEQLLIIPSEKVKIYSGTGPFFEDEDIDFCTKDDGIPKYRWEVENDPSFKQLVVYVVVTDGHNRVFVTHRKDGDERLVGKYSIGIGGHVRWGESFTEAMFRELEEEVGITPDDMTGIVRHGYILDNSSDVNSVHLGIVYMVDVQDPSKVFVREPEKLVGQWMDAGDGLARLYHSNSLESWSETVYRNCI